MYGNRVNSGVSSATTGRRRWNKSSDDMGTCVCLGGGVERVTYGLVWCVFAWVRGARMWAQRGDSQPVQLS